MEPGSSRMRIEPKGEKKMTRKTGTAKSKIAKRVQFELPAPEAGDINNWDADPHPMKKDKAKNGR